MSNAIKDLAKSSGKPPILFSLCEWGRVLQFLAFAVVLFTDGILCFCYGRGNRGCGLGNLDKVGG